MYYQQTTQVPNAIFDLHLPFLTHAELKITLVIIRQTFGWICKNTGKRKTRDRLSLLQFQRKTGLSRRIITKTIQSLYRKDLIRITDFKGNELKQSQDRKGKKSLFFSLNLPVQLQTKTSAHAVISPAHLVSYNKTNLNKPNPSKPKSAMGGHIKEVLGQKIYCIPSSM